MDLGMPFPKGTAKSVERVLLQRRLQPRLHLRPLLTAGGPDVFLQRRLPVRWQGRVIGAADGRGGDRHAGAHVHARDDHRRARPQGVDQQDVQALPHAQVHVGARGFGQFG
jgi:hypothetical protein